MATKEIIEIKRPEIVKTTIRIVGDSPLIMNRWTTKAKQQMLDQQMGKGTKKKEPKEPVSDFIQSMYWMTPRPIEMTEEAFNAAIRAEGPAYESINVIVQQEDKYAALLDQCKKELQTFLKKYNSIKELAPIADAAKNFIGA